jgi:capsular exopolysaccharide synthesis family protein
LKHSEDALEAYAKNSGIIFTDTQAETNVATEKLQQIQQSLSAAMTDRTAKQARFELAKSASPDSLGDVLSDEGLQDLSAKVDNAKQQLADLTTIYDPTYVRVKRIQAQLDTLQGEFQEQRTNVLHKIENDYIQASRNEKLLDNAYLAQESKVTGQDEKTVQYNILRREVESNRQLYDTMLQQMKQASIASALHASNVRVSDAPQVPSIPIFPNLKLNAVLGMFAGALLSIVVVTIRERTDRTLQMPGDIRQQVGLRELGTIPSVDSARSNAYSFGAAALEKRSVEEDPTNVVKIGLSTHLNKSGVAAEAFRSCLTSILFVSGEEAAPKVLLFTSTQSGDGKTTVVSNIGIALAEIRSKTLIIDADMRRPSMHRLFNLPNNRGLSNLLQEEFNESSAMELIQVTSVPHLHLLCAGPPSAAAGHLLHSPNLLAFIKRVRADYDMVLIDTPPMIQMTDARLLGRLTDATVLVARAGVTTRDALSAAKERFEEDHTSVIGCILNNWNVKRATGSYYYSQYRKYKANYDSIGHVKS